MEGDGQLAQARSVFKDAGGWGSLRHCSAAHASWGVEGRDLARRSRPLVQELRGLVISAADCTQRPLALLIMASPWQPAGPALETALVGSSRQSAQLPGSPRGQAGGSRGRRRLGASVQGPREPVPLRPQLSPSAEGHLMPSRPVMQAGQCWG